MNKLKSLFSDNVRIIACLSSLALCGYHVYQYFLIGNNICFLRIAMYLILALTIFMFSFRIMYLELIIMALIASYFNSFINFTQFFVILLACRMYRKSENWLLALYALNESVALMIQGKNISHLIIHLLTCIFFYMIYFFINKPKVLDLKPDEEEIVKQLAAGKLQKQIDLYSKNIIKDKLDHAKDRNHIIDTDELVFLYKQSHSQSQY